ncbi:hypothetical protein KFE25_007520 [Diacronema lutheri]|uniref:AAA+ ATPase domain-containing protein n=1 Tax=Diacronema lutheri TaxID=2081491 RepID=A0A8J5XUX7_DIALT|nr:hypothetical protein KFE25_007520 [Diacronema lutheri]
MAPSRRASRGAEAPSPRSAPRRSAAADVEGGGTPGASVASVGVVGRLCALPADAPAAGDASAPCALLGWELFAQLGACVGDAIELGAPGGARAHVRAWASRKLPPAGIALDRRARALLARGCDGVLAPRAELLLAALAAQPARAAAIEMEVDARARVSIDDALTAYARAWLCGAALARGAQSPLPWQGRDVWLTLVAARLEDGSSPADGVPVRVEMLTALRLVCAGPSGAGAVGSCARAPERPAVALDAPPIATPAAKPAAAPVVAPAERSRSAGDEPSRALGALGALGGVPDEVWQALADLRLALHRPALFAELGVRPMRGCLVCGPVGSGRTAVARALAADAAVAYDAGEMGGAGSVPIYVSAARLLAERGVAGVDGALLALFARARAAAPAVVVLDELELLAPPRGGGGGGGGASTGAPRVDAAARAVGALLTALDGVCSSAAVALIATCVRADDVEPALRRPGRLDLEIELSPPTARDRLDMLTRMTDVRARERGGAGVTAPSVQLLRALAARSHGYVAADLAALLRELEWLRADADTGADVTVDVDADADVDADDAHRALSEAEARLLSLALARVPPSALRDAQLEIPTVRWSDIGGQEEAIGALREAIEWPLRHARSFARLGVRAPRGVLLYGPPGCSKTLTAKALASESGLNFVAVKGPELFSKWVGESEKAVQGLFRKARAAAPAIIFFDEIDALAPSRAGVGAESAGGGGGGSAVGMRVLAQLLHEMDGVGGAESTGSIERAHVVVLGATNRPDLIDAALLRPGRFDRLLYVGLPERAARLAILRVHTRGTPLAADVRLEQLAERTRGYSGAELAAVCREAALAALTEAEDAADVAMRHFEAALRAVTPRTPAALLELYARYQQGVSRAERGGAQASQPGDRPLPQSLIDTAGSLSLDEPEYV